MQDGTRSHTAHAILDHLKVLFPNRLISLNRDHEWDPPQP